MELISGGRGLVGEIVWEAFPRPPGGIFETACRKVMAERVPVLCEDVYPPLGIWFQNSIHPCSDGIVVYFRDVTAAKRQEQALRESEERSRQQLAELETIYATAPIGLAVLSADCQFLRLNERLAAMNGLPVAAHLGRTIREILPQFADCFEGIVRSVVETGNPVLNLEVEGGTAAEPGIRRAWVEQWLPQKDAAGRVVCINVVVEEVTERKRAEASLRDDRARFRALFDEAPVGVTMVATDGRFLAVNDQFCGMLGYSRDQLLRRGFAEITHPDDLERCTGHWVRLVRGETDSITLEKRYIRKDGAIVWARLKSCIVREGAPGEAPYELSIIEDITAHQEAQAALAESEERLRLAQAAARAGVWDWDIRTGVNRWTPEQYRLFGLEAATYGPVSYDTWRDRVHPDDIGREEAKVRVAVETGGPYDSEFRILHPDGVRWLIARSKVIRDETGAPARMVGINIDITERKQIEQELRDRNAELEAVLDAVPAAVWIAHDPECRVVTTNRTGAALLEVVPGANASKSAPGAERPQNFKVVKDGAEVPADELPMQRAAATGEEVRGFEEDIVFDDGRVRHVYGNAAPLRDASGKVRGAVGAFVDVTEMVVAREALARSRDELERIIHERTREIRKVNEHLRQEKEFSEMLLASTNDGVFAFDRELRYTLWNPAMERISGMSAAQVIGRAATEIFPFIAGTRIEEVMHRAVAGEPGTLSDEPYDVPETGRSGYFECSYSPLRDRSDQITGAVAILRETTERRAIEQQLRQAQKMEAVGQLTGGIAHDFNNLLTVLAGNLELIQSRAPKDEQIGRLAKAAFGATERAAELTGQLLAFSRVQKMQLRTVDVLELVRGFENVLKRAVGEAIELVIWGDASLSPSRVDPAHFETALLNLVLNARDAMPDGGRLGIEIGNIDVEEDGFGGAEVPRGRYITIAVSDTGCGMSAETIQHAFVPFFTTKDVGKGTGLGLSMVYGFVKQSGGHIAIDSVLGSGTKIVIYLPAAEVETANREIHDSREIPSGSEMILLAEDDAAVDDVLTEILCDLGYNVLSAPTGRDVIELLKSREDIDLLMTDVVMPGGMTGVEVAREARRLRPEIKVLLISGYPERVLMARHAYDEFPILGQAPEPSLARPRDTQPSRHRHDPTRHIARSTYLERTPTPRA